MSLEHRPDPVHLSRPVLNPFLAELMMPTNQSPAGQSTEQPLMVASLSWRPEDLLRSPNLLEPPRLNPFDQQREDRLIAALREMQGQHFDRASEILNSELRILEKRHGANSPALREVLSNLGICELRLGQPQTACDLLERSLRLFEPSQSLRLQCSVRTNLALCHLALAEAGGTAEERQQHRTRAAEVLTQGLSNIGYLAQSPTHARLLEMLGTVELSMAPTAQLAQQRVLYADAQRHFEEALRIMESHGMTDQLGPVLARHIQACLGANAANPSVEQLRAALPSYRRLVEIGDAQNLSPFDRASNYYNLAFALGNIAGSQHGLARGISFAQAASSFNEAIRLLEDNAPRRNRQLLRHALQNYIYCCNQLPAPEPGSDQARELEARRQQLQRLQNPN
jgi:tetratricopeptide (TPR) repeat protein